MPWPKKIVFSGLPSKKCSPVALARTKFLLK